MPATHSSLLYQNTIKISTNADQPQPALPLPAQQFAKPRMKSELRVPLEEFEGLEPGLLEQVCVADDVRRAKVGQAGLPRTEELAWTALAEGLLRRSGNRRWCEQKR